MPWRVAVPAIRPGRAAADTDKPVRVHPDYFRTATYEEWPANDFATPFLAGDPRLRLSVTVMNPPDPHYLAVHVLDALNEALIVTTFTGEVVHLNGAARQLVQKEPGQANGRPVAELLNLHAPDGEPVRPMAHFLDQPGRARDGGLVYLARGDGERLPMRGWCTVIRGGGDEAVGLLLVLRAAHDDPASPDPLAGVMDRAAPAYKAGHPATDDTRRAKYASLTPREREILTHVVAGMTNKQIARKLRISHRTVEVHRARIMTKFGVNSAVELVSYAARAI